MKAMIFTVFLASSLIGCTTILENSFPMPKLVESGYKSVLFGYDEYHVTFHNDGAKGKVFIKLTHGNNVYTKSVFFDKGERRSVVFKLTEKSDAGSIGIEAIAEELNNLRQD